jgi:hypothetical protein
MADPMITAHHFACQAVLDQAAATQDDVIAAGIAAALRVMADEIDRGPTFPLPPSVISALVRERAEGLTTP